MRFLRRLPDWSRVLGIFEHEQIFSEFAKLFLKECELTAFTGKRYENWSLKQKPGV